MPWVPLLPGPGPMNAHLWWSLSDFNSSLHPVLLSQPCSVTWAQYLRAAPHIRLLLVYGVYLPFCPQLVQDACGLVKPNTSSRGNQPGAEFDTFLSNGLLREPYNFCRVCFVNSLASMSSCIRKVHPVCFSEEGISIPPNGKQKQWVQKGPVTSASNCLVEEPKIMTALLEDSLLPGNPRNSLPTYA